MQSVWWVDLQDQLEWPGGHIELCTHWGMSGKLGRGGFRGNEGAASGWGCSPHSPILLPLFEMSTVWGAGAGIPSRSEL